MLDSSQVIFSNTINNSKDSPNFLHVVKDTVFELSHKKFQNIKSDEHLLLRLGELLDIFIDILDKNGLKNSQTIASVIEGLIKATIYKKEQSLYQSVYEKEKLERTIDTQRQDIKELLVKSYLALESSANKLEEDDKNSVIASVQDERLRGVEMLGILKETAEEAYLRAIEKGEEIESTIAEITKNFVYQTVSEGKFEKRRIFEIIKNLLEVAGDIAETDQSCAKEILYGAVFGAKNGIYKSVEKFKNDLRFAPEETEDFLGESLEESKKQFLKIEDTFILTLKNIQAHSSGIVADILGEIIEQYDNSYAKLKRIGVETAEKIEILKEEATKKIAELTKEASVKAQIIKEETTPKALQAAEDAKKLGLRAWEVAKGMLDSAVSTTMDAINKDKKNKDDKK